MRVTFSGQLAPGVTAKDMMLALIAAHGAGGGAGHVVEFAGEAVTALDMEARMTLCNMATEFSAFAGLIAPDEVTFAWLKGRKVAAGIRAICVPGSSAVRRAAEAEGLDRVFLDAGFEWRESGCSMCFFAGGESFAEGSRVISSTNRNFESRQGLRVKTHIASPETVAASALAGAIADARDWAHG